MLSRSHSPSSTRPPSRVSCEFDSWYQELGIHSIDDIPERCSSLIEWTKTKPLFMLRLDPVDRAVLRIADERDEIQKKTFTKWVNKHLIKANRRVIDLFEDLRDGENLVSLLEVLSQKVLPRERGRMRVHMLQNVQNALDFLKRRRIKLVNIRPDDIVDSNQKLTLGLIWTIILHYQISDIIQTDDNTTLKEALLKWAQKTTEGYPGVKVKDFTNSWKDGLAFNAILHRNRPDLLDYRKCLDQNNRENLENAFRIGEQDLGITRLLEPEDVDTKNIDEKSMITYISSLYELFPEPPERNPYLDEERLRSERERALAVAREAAKIAPLIDWLNKSERRLRAMLPIPTDQDQIRQRVAEHRVLHEDILDHKKDFRDLTETVQNLVTLVGDDEAKMVVDRLREVTDRYAKLVEDSEAMKRLLAAAYESLGTFVLNFEDIIAWMQEMHLKLNRFNNLSEDLKKLREQIEELTEIGEEIRDHHKQVVEVNTMGQRVMQHASGLDVAEIKDKLTALNGRFDDLAHRAAERLREAELRLRELEGIYKQAGGFRQEVQDLLSWLNEVDNQISASKPIGGTPESAREQLDSFMELFNELEAHQPKVESCLRRGPEYIKMSPDGMSSELSNDLKTLKTRWDSAVTRANDRKIKLEIALKDAIEFHEALQQFVDWLTSAESYLNNMGPVSSIVENILHQIEEHKNFQKDVSNHRETMLNLDKKGTHLKYFSQKQDVIVIKNLLISIQHRWERVVQKAAERTRALDRGYKEAREFHDAWSGLINWLKEAESQLDEHQPVGNDPERIRQYLIKHQEFQRELGAKQSTYDATMKLGRILKEKSPKTDVPVLSDMLEELKNRWNSACAKSVDRQRKLEEALLFSGQFKDAIQALIDWIEKAKSRLGLNNLHGDLDTVTGLVDQHRAFQEDLKSRRNNMTTIKKTATDLLNSASATDATTIRNQLSTLDSRWEEIVEMSDAKQRCLEEALRRAEELHKAVHSLLEWLSDAEMKLRSSGSLPDEEDATQQKIIEHETFLREMSKQEINKDSTIALAENILAKAHPDAVPVIRHWITIIRSRWDEVSNWAKQHESRLKDHLKSLRDILDIFEELLNWLRKAEADLLAAEAKPLPDDIESLERLIEEHQKFIDEMSAKQPEVERVTKAFTAVKRTRQVSDLKGGRRSTSKTRSETPVGGARGGEPEIKNTKARELVEKWRSVWLLAMERMRRLQDKLDYIREVERVKNFEFDEWRRRFLGWMNNKKARVMDFFRKIDKDNDGKVTQEEFIEGFLESKFPTSRLEMERVAPIFDRNSDGFIDHKEYLETLRPDRDLPKTESEIIQDEVQRQVSKCTCVHRYKVFQVGEGKYRFGDSQKLRLVRILRSTVMVRVGGGWVSLDEFLIKNDPCRAKGRTNVELREQFILAEGVSQGMAAFKAKPVIDPKTGAVSTVGPITKIREKTERSVPMSRSFRFGGSTSDCSFSDTDSGSKSRPGSQMTIKK